MTPATTLLLPNVRSSRQQEEWTGQQHLNLNVEQDVTLEGYQLYAVESWIADRRPIAHLLVYTGEPSHTASVKALRPPSTLSLQESQDEFDKAVKALSHGNDRRPRKTPSGTVFVTSLAHFRSDCTIVLIPNGDFHSVADQLYANINLSRLNCSGRSALTSEQPSEATKERFLTHFSFPRSTIPFSQAVLEFIKLVQSALVIFGALLDFEPDGLLCDLTVKALQNHPSGTNLSTPLDPSSLCLLLSTIISNRNKLAALTNHHHHKIRIPKDPLLHPQTFLRALRAWHESTLARPSGSRTHSRSNSTTSVNVQGLWPSNNSSSGKHHSPRVSMTGPSFLKDSFRMGHSEYPLATTSAYRAALSLNSDIAPLNKSTPYLSSEEKDKAIYLNTEMIQLISNTYAHDELRHIGSSSRPGSTDNLHHLPQVHKLSNTLAAVVSGLDEGGDVSLEAIFEPSQDLSRFVRGAVGGAGKTKRRGKRESLSVALLGSTASPNSESEGDVEGHDSAKEDIVGVGASIRALWSGNVSMLARMRKVQIAAISPLPSPTGKRRRGGREVDKMSPWSDDNEADTDSASSEHGPTGLSFGTKLSDWTGLNKLDMKLNPTKQRQRRNKKYGTSIDFGPPLSFSSSGQGESETASRIISLNSVRQPDAYKRSRPQLNTRASTKHDFLTPPEDDFPSSGGASPASDFDADDQLHVRPSMHSRVPTSRTVNSSKAKKTARLDVEEDERVRRYLGPTGRRTENVRVTSWADPKSALSEHEPGMEDGGGVEGNQPQSRPHERGHTRGDSLLGGELYDEPMSMDEYVEPHNAQPSLVRRHSYHNLQSINVERRIPLNRLRIDVSLCAEFLVQTRREEHLRNVALTLEILTHKLTKAAEQLENDYLSHQGELSTIADSSVFIDLDKLEDRVSSIVNAKDTLIYEKGMFSHNALWGAVAPHRKAIWRSREKVFGTGGAGGKQWLLNGGTRYVDNLGRTESEAEEEERLFAQDEDDDVSTREGSVQQMEEQEPEPVASGGYGKPMWMLRIFERWSAIRSEGKPKAE